MSGDHLPVGIEKIGVYPGSMVLEMSTLCAARGRDEADLRDYLLVDERSVLPPWEDTVTLGANAAAPMLSPEDRDSIGLLMVGTESALDLEKPISSWLHGALELPSDCRNFEVKHACYGATGALQMACAWLGSGLARGRKALVVSADASLLGLGEPYEAVMGACGCAILLSSHPRLAQIELEPTGIHAHDVTDVIRPTPRLETGNSESSLFSYIEALVGAYANYESQWPGGIDFDAHFAGNIYHAPFGGMTWRAHRTLLSQFSQVPPDEVEAHFLRKVEPSLVFNRRIGGSYGASTMVALLGLCATANDLHPGDRVGMYAFGSGSCAEFYGVRLAPDFRRSADDAALPALLDARRKLSIEEYEAAERTRDCAIGMRDLEPHRDSFGGLFATHYAGQHRLVLQNIRDYCRSYAWA